MSTIQRIAKNTTVLMIAQVAGYLLAFFSMMYIARYLGAAGFGILSFALALTGIFAVFGDLGLQPLTVREVAGDKSLALKYVANVSLMKVILAAVTFGLIALTVNLMGYPSETIKVVYLLALSVIFAARFLALIDCALYTPILFYAWPFPRVLYFSNNKLDTSPGFALRQNSSVFFIGSRTCFPSLISLISNP